ncbi:MAG: peptidylprolyl isomerase [Planctomycetes bacterium]|nr:peptidylprolyl isomerase [Planctomycetota bacterium]
MIRRVLTAGLLLAAVALPAMAQDSPEAKAKVAKAQADQNAIMAGVKIFESDAGRSPKSLGQLLKQPADLAGNWKGPYLDDLGNDPWGKAYTLEIKGGKVQVTSLGSDGKPGGVGEAADILSTAPVFKASAEVKQSLALSATLKATTAEVGSLAILTVTLTNTGKTAVELPKLAEDRQLISFDVQLEGGRVFAFEKITPSPFTTKLDWETGSLKPGESWDLEVPFPVLLTGKLTITTHYGRKAAPRLKAKPSHVTAKPVVLEMVATASGADTIAIKLSTSLGPIHMRLFPEEALGTSLHYARLILVGAKAQGKGEVRKPYYRGLKFHRVMPGFMIQGGCPLGNGLGDAGYSIPAEFAKPGSDGRIPEKLRHVPGKLSMARSSHDDSAGTQFFICTATPTHLDGKYTCFGEVTRGLDVAMTIADVDADQSSKPKSDVMIDGIRIEAVKSK